jgi:hypothetical protein
MKGKNESETILCSELWRRAKNKLKSSYFDFQLKTDYPLQVGSSHGENNDSHQARRKNEGSIVHHTLKMKYLLF